ncbi:peroxidase family protein [Roseibium sp. Sym1]|uniref:peroxidase family protein n=1 Tax=Roseibium sp. Sym1 TaxID=3016006 RepID=UPI0022B3D1F1|nr:peroxidase family protein [Roseibium sp. Sym1]
MTRPLRDHPPRDQSADGFTNRLQAYVLSHFPWLWKIVMAIGPLRRLVNTYIINSAVMRARSRPSPYSSMAVHGDVDKPMAGYTSWESMTDRDWFKRHLPQKDLKDLPPLEDLRELYEVKEGEETLSEDSSVLFLSFAQWFTDGFLMTSSDDFVEVDGKRIYQNRKTHTSHHIDFNTLYGLNRAHSDAIRLKLEETGRKGRLKSETDPDTGEEYAPRYFGANGKVKPAFKDLLPPLRLKEFLETVERNEGKERADAIRQHIFAFAGERANTTPYTAMLTTLFLREHNRLCGILEKAHPSWDDERVFQTARNINIALLIKIVVEEYINHISPYYFQLSADPSVCWKAEWNKPNWIPIEFNLLYRWHSLTPDYFKVAGKSVAGEQFIYDNSHLTGIGLGKAMESASQQKAWNIGLMNTPDFLVSVELASVQQGRANHLASYNDYREAFGYGRVKTFEQITGDPRRIKALSRLYKDSVDNVELFVGLFAEDVAPRSAVPPLIGRMVALDAFSQALTNPLLSQHAFNAGTFSQEGMKVIESTSRLQQILDRNQPQAAGTYKVTMTI